MDWVSAQLSQLLLLFLASALSVSVQAASLASSVLLRSSKGGNLIRSEVSADLIGQQVHIALQANSGHEVQFSPTAPVGEGLLDVVSSQVQSFRPGGGLNTQTVAEWLLKRSELQDFVELNERLPKTRSEDPGVAPGEAALATWLEKQFRAPANGTIPADKVSALEEAAHIKVDKFQAKNWTRNWTRLTKPEHPDFFVQTVPAEAYPGIEGDLGASAPESLAKILARTSHRLARDYCHTCAVVGGVSSLLKRDSPGREIDEHDCVFRVNHGVSSFTLQEQPSVSGQKTTHYMFYCCYDHDERFRLAHKNASDWIFLPTSKDGTDWAISALEDGRMDHDLVVMDPRFATRVKVVAGLSHRPLSGTLMLSVAMQICNSTVDLYGFDTSDMLSYNTYAHRPIEDHEWIRHLDSEGAVRIH